MLIYANSIYFTSTDWINSILYKKDSKCIERGKNIFKDSFGMFFFFFALKSNRKNLLFYILSVKKSSWELTGKKPDAFESQVDFKLQICRNKLNFIAKEDLVDKRSKKKNSKLIF